MSKKKTTEEFILQAQNIHKNLYKYDVTEYINAKTPVKIRCNIHGIVSVNPTTFPNRGGCPKCGRLKGNLNTRYTRKEIIDKFKKCHNDKYNYDKFVYSTAEDKSIATCKKHGDFIITPAFHMRGTGCPKCANEREKFGFRRTDFIDKYKNKLCILYVLKCWNDHERFIKIGITGTSIEKRFEGKKLPYNYKIIKTIIHQPDRIWDLEQEIKRSKKEFKYLPIKEFGGKTECYNLNILTYLINGSY